MKNIKYLAFIKAVDLGSFSKAGEELGYTQSGLTHMMNRFEEEVGFKLIQRGFYGVKPTERGKQLLPIIREIVKSEESLKMKIDQIKFNEKSVIRIGAYSSMALNWLPSIVENFNKDYKDVVVKIQTGTVPALYSGLETDMFDIVFVSKNEKYSAEFIPLKTDEMLAILPKDYYIGEPPKSFPITELEGKSFLMPGLGFNVDIHKMLQDYKISPKIEETFVDDMAIISMVEHGLGISMLSKLIIKNNHNNILALKLEPSIKRLLGIAYSKNKELNDNLKTFIKYAEKHIRAYDL